MINSELVIQLITEYWPDENLISGRENVKNIVEDAIAGIASEENFTPLAVGDDFDIFAELGVILAAAQLIISIIQMIMDHQKEKATPALNEAATKAVIENYVNAVNSKAWKLLNPKQRAEFIERLIEVSRKNKK